MTKEQARLLRFAIKYDGWHTYGGDAKRTLSQLEYHGLIEVSEKTKQFRLKKDASN